MFVIIPLSIPIVAGDCHGAVDMQRSVVAVKPLSAAVQLEAMMKAPIVAAAPLCATHAITTGFVLDSGPYHRAMRRLSEHSLLAH